MNNRTNHQKAAILRTMARQIERGGPGPIGVLMCITGEHGEDLDAFLHSNGVTEEGVMVIIDLGIKGLKEEMKARHDKRTN